MISAKIVSGNLVVENANKNALFLLHILKTGYSTTYIVSRGIIGPGGWLRLW